MDLKFIDKHFRALMGIMGFIIGIIMAISIPVGTTLFRFLFTPFLGVFLFGWVLPPLVKLLGNEP